ncbi:hypothetical protein CALCODRAFT_298796 [Calocera cornea HHB12733]|uniref:Uncharacterized protein n=1 Tax=Calocera cornea HHB12733 TaxID=1353952 RepID=A0A165FJJ8_9BASI|nr:hypothetical protein CALCODRAFT_298796 [Calocera cornea HHB12733]
MVLYSYPYWGFLPSVYGLSRYRDPPRRLHASQSRTPSTTIIDRSMLVPLAALLTHALLFEIIIRGAIHYTYPGRL